MTTLLFTALLAHQASDDEAGRFAAVQSVVELARRIEAVCQPRFLTNPPTPFRVVPDLPVSAEWARAFGPGAYRVRFGDVGGIVNDGVITLTFRNGQRLPEGARRWTRDELVANARKVADLFTPADYALGGSRDAEARSFHIVTDLVVGLEPRLHVGEIGIPMNPATGMPQSLQVPTRRPHVVAPERLQGILPEEDLAAEAVRVYRSLPPFGPARLSDCRYTYSIPNCANMPNEMTDEHRGNVARGEAIPLYCWRLIEHFQGGFRSGWSGSTRERVAQSVQG